MSNQILSFNFKNSNIRSELINDEPWFVAKDLCINLGYSIPHKAIRDHVYDEDVLKRITPTNSGNQNMLWVNESGMYALIFGSKLDTAKEFKCWVTKEVLPQIRKTGKYEQKPKLTMRQGYVPASKDLWNMPDSYFLDKIEEYHKKNIIKNSLALDIKYCFDMRARDNIINTIRLVENTPVLPETKLSTSEFLSMDEQEKLVIMRENGLKYELYSFNENLKWYKFKKCPFPYIDLQSVAMLFGFDIKLLKIFFFKNIDNFILGKDLIIIDNKNKIDDESYLLSFTGIERIFNYYFA